MTDSDIFDGLPSERGHFLLESGYHTNLWLTLDRLFLAPTRVAPLVTALAERLAGHHPTAICGPLRGGAFLAQALATTLGLGFYFTEPGPTDPAGRLFGATYRLPAGLSPLIRGERLAIVDDVISAGSSVRATAATVAAAGATVAVVGALAVMGSIALEHFDGLGVPVVSLARHDLPMWPPASCPLCQAGVPLRDPGQTSR